VLRFQVTVKALPLPLSELGWASTSPEESTMVISSSLKVEMTPDVDPDFTVAPVSDQVLKCASG